MSLSTVVVSNWTAFAGYRELWLRFESRCHDMVPFFRWVFLERWWSTFASEQDSLHVILVLDGSAIVGALPTYIRPIFEGGITARVLRFLGTGEAEYEEVKSEFGTVFLDSSAAESVLTTLINTLYETRAKWDVAEFNDVLERSVLARALTANIHPQIFHTSTQPLARRYRLMLTEDVAGGFGRRLDRKLRQAYRYLDAQNPGWSVEWAAPADLDSAFSTMAKLHQANWSTRGVEGAFTSARFIEFHRLIVADWHACGSARLLTLEADEGTLGVLYLLVCNGSVYFYQSGLMRNSNSQFRPGYILHEQAIKKSHEAGCRAYDFMGGSLSSYKREFVAPGDLVRTQRVYHSGIRSRWLRLSRALRTHLGSWRQSIQANQLAYRVSAA